MKISHWFVDSLLANGRILFLLFLFVVGFGGYSLASLQRQGFPDVEINAVSVNVIYPNASAEIVEKDVIIPLEGAIDGVEAVTDYSVTAVDNAGFLFVTLDPKSDLDKEVGALRNAVSAINLPDGAQEAEVKQFSIADTGSFVAAVSGYANEWDLYEAGSVYEKELSRLDGVKVINALNPLDPQVRITWKTERLQELGFTRGRVEDVVKGLQFVAPVGSFVENEETVTVAVSREISSIEELLATEIAPGVTLSDVADIETGLDNNDYYNRIGYRTDDEFSVERSLLFSVALEADADILKVEEELIALNERLAGEHAEDGSGKGVSIEGNRPTYVTVYSQATSTRQQISEITQSIFGTKFEGVGVLGYVGYLLGGLGLVVILLFFFMNLRVAIMAALAIPLSLFFATMYLQFVGIDLNTLVLFSMVLVIGLVIDPAIVFLESMQRNIEKGLSGRDAAVETVRTVGVGVFLAVATNVLVFVPFGLVSGFFGEIIKYIPATVIPAMVGSMLVPMLFFMPLASFILRPGRGKAIDPDDLHATWRIGRFTARMVKRLLKDGGWNAVMRLLVFLVVMALPLVTIFGTIETGAVKVVQFASAEDADFMLIEGDVPDTWNFEKAVYDVVVPVQNVLAEQEEIKTFFYFSQTGNDFSILVELLPIAEREDLELRKATPLAEDLTNAFSALNLEAEVFATVSSEGPPQESTPVKVRFYADDLDVLATASQDVGEYLRSREDVTRVTDTISQATSGGTTVLHLDTQNLINLNAFTVFGALNGRLSENALMDLELNGDRYEVVTNVDDVATSQRDVLETTIVVPSMDPRIPATEIEVGDLVDYVDRAEGVRIQRANGERFVEISAGLTESADALAVQADLEEYLDVKKIQALGLTEDAVDYEGEADAIGESFGDLFLALGVAIFLIYLLLVGFFRSFFEPFIILFAIPLGLVGVFMAIALTTGQLGFLELIGVVAMAGIVVNVTILLIDYANILKREGKDVNEAISTAIGVRLRPILLTQLTAFGSLVPLVYLSPFWKGLAASIIFGIASSAILSILSTPILYKWAHTAGTIWKKWHRS